MMERNRYHLMNVCLILFDGAAAGGGAGDGAAAAGGDGTPTSNGSEAPAASRRGKSGAYKNVLFGKQSAAASGEAQQDGQPSDAGKAQLTTEPETVTTSDALEERRKAYRALVDGEFKEQYTEDTQRMLNRRFREMNDLRRTLDSHQPVMDLLMRRYGITDGNVAELQAAIENDNVYWSEAAAQAGMSVDQFKEVQHLKVENAALRKAQDQSKNQQLFEQRLQQLAAENNEVRKVYPNFNLNAESENPRFMHLLKAGVPMRHAYEVIHMDEIVAAQAKATEKQVVDGIRAKGARPRENGISSQGGFTTKSDVTKLTRAERAEIARRVARGERIEF